MTSSVSLSATDRHPQDTQRAELIVRTSHLAFEVEAAERNDLDQREIARLRVDYHGAMAELMAITPCSCPEMSARIDRAAKGHADQLTYCQSVLARLEASQP